MRPALNTPMGPRNPRNPRGAFTLIELLVVITILLILTFTTVSVLNTTFDSDRIRSSSRQVQSALLGARDRALRAGRDYDPGDTDDHPPDSPLRGLRFMIDPASAPGAPMVTSMVYVRQLMHDQGRVAIGRADDDGNGFADDDVRIVLRGYGTDWKRMYDLGLLVTGAKMTFPVSTTGSVYIVDASPLATYSGDGAEVLILSSEFRGAPTIAYGTSPTPEGPDGEPGIAMVDDDGNGTTDDGFEFGWLGSDDATDIHAMAAFAPFEYVLTLQPAVDAGQEPIRLSSGICIDLAHSENIPPYGLGYFDVMFSPRGTVVGPLAASGMVNFLLTQITDAARGIPGDAPFWTASTAVTSGIWCIPTARNTFLYRCTVAGTTGGAEPTWPTNTAGTVVDGSATWEAVDIGERLVLSLRTQTGGVSSHAVYLHAAGEPTDPFRYARRGEVAGR